MTTDGYDSYPRAIRRIVGRKGVQRTSQYLNNRLEQDHRAIKQRYYSMRGFGAFVSAARFCTAFDELGQYFRSRTTSQKTLLLSEQRHRFRQRFADLSACCRAA